MKAVVQDRYGSAAVLSVRDVAMPVPDSTSVIVKVRAASVNGLDWRMLSGRPRILRLLGFGLLRPKRRVRGVDVAGVVESAPSAGSKFHAGDEVFGLGSGSFAEYVAADEREIVLKPAGVSFRDASTLGVAAFTALQAVRDHAHVGAGQRVLVTAAGSGVGSFAVSIAKVMGAHVTAVTSTPFLELAKRLGADEVIDYTKDDFTRRPERYDAIIDVSGRKSLSSAWRTLRPGGILVVVGGQGSIGRFLVAALQRTILRRRILGFIAKGKLEDFRTLGEWTAEGRLRPAIDRTFPLDQGPQAMAYVEAHRVGGKVVLEVS